MKPKEKMYDAAIKAFAASSQSDNYWLNSVRAAVDAALALVPVVTVDEALAGRVYDAYARPEQRVIGAHGMLSALREVLPAGPLVVAEAEKTRNAGVRGQTMIVHKQFFVQMRERYVSAEARVKELEADVERLKAQCETAEKLHCIEGEA